MRVVNAAGHTLLILTALVGLAIFAFGQTDLTLQLPNTAAIAKDRVKLLASPPSEGFWLFTIPGKEVGVLGKGQQVTVLDKQVVKTFAGDSVWAKVQTANRDNAPAAVGWVYWGAANKPSESFTVDPRSRPKDK